MRAIELFCGIGGFAVAAGERCEIVAAVDINRDALAVYDHNFSHTTFTREIESLPTDWLAQWDADLWWMSPPCQPYTRRGLQRDLNDNRTASLLAVVDRICELKPTYIALENVPEFANSQALAHFNNRLTDAGYSFRQMTLCPTDWGSPMRRRRFYLIASRGKIAEAKIDTSLPPTGDKWTNASQTLSNFLDRETDPQLTVDPAILAKYSAAIDIVDAAAPSAVCNCFTSAYGRSPVRSGSLLRSGDLVRRFSPAEIVRLLGFPPTFHIPDSIPLARQWSLVGNSLAVDAVARVLSWIPSLA